MQYNYEGIEYHNDNIAGPAHAAVNVKIQAHIDIPDEHQKHGDTAWLHVQERFWEDVGELARERGYAGVYSEGRSAGWCVPYHSHYKGHDLNMVSQQSYYPDVDQVGERSRFRAFQSRVEVMLEDVPRQLREAAEHLYEQDADDAVNVVDVAMAEALA